MGNGADRTVHEGTDVRFGQLRGLWIALLFLGLGSGTAAGTASGPMTLTVHVVGGSTKTTLRLQPGYATVLRADHRVETVAIGDPRLVTATTVKRGQDVYDLVLQPQTATGVTNMIVWLGDLTSIWEITIGPGQRTADIVYVVTAAPAVTQSKPPSLQAVPSPAPESAGADPASPLPTAGRSSAEGGTSPRPEAHSPKAEVPSMGEQYLEAQQTLKDATGIFQLSRGRGGIAIRYRITNRSGMDFSIRPNGILVRVNERLVPFGMSRDNADRGRPTILPPGTTEAGVIRAPAKAPRQVEVIFSVFPAERNPRRPSRMVPTTFQLMFAGLERLASSSP